MNNDDRLIGSESLVDGTRITVRMRRDLLVTDAAAVLAAGRKAFLVLHPDATAYDAEVQIADPVDAVYALLERDGLMSGHGTDGLASGPGRRHVTFNDPQPPPDPAHCFDDGHDYFALPPADQP